MICLVPEKIAIILLVLPGMTLGNDIGKYNPNEFSIEIAYAKQITDKMSLGFTGKYLNSDLASGQNSSGVVTMPASTAAFDLGWYYENTTRNNSRVSYGLVLTNIGPKIRQSTGGGQFLPMELRFGTQVHLEGYNSGWNFSLDVNKLLVPTPPIYLKDSMGGVGTSSLLMSKEKFQPLL